LNICQVVCGLDDSQETRNRYTVKDPLIESKEKEKVLEIDPLSEKLKSSPQNSPSDKSMKMLALSKMASKNLIKKDKFTQLNFIFYDKKIVIVDGSVATLMRHLIGEAGLGFGIYL
jgi:hypothetical protein